MRKLLVFLLALGLFAVSSFPQTAYSDDEVKRTVIITIYISAFDCTHGNAIPNVNVTLLDPLTEQVIKSGKTGPEGKLMIWYTKELESDEDAESEAFNTTVELDKPGSDCLVREFDEYCASSGEFHATIERDYCMKGCYKDWKLYQEVSFPGYAENNCPGLFQLSQTRKCSESEVGKRLSPPCTISWKVDDVTYKRECALICSGGYGYQHWVDLRCSEVYQEGITEKETTRERP